MERKAIENVRMLMMCGERETERETLETLAPRHSSDTNGDRKQKTKAGE